jgi:hypothetical protein
MKNNSIGLLELETAVLECFLEKTPLSPLRVKSRSDSQGIKSRDTSTTLSSENWPISNVMTFAGPRVGKNRNIYQVR